LKKELPKVKQGPIILEPKTQCWEIITQLPFKLRKVWKSPKFKEANSNQGMPLKSQQSGTISPS